MINFFDALDGDYPSHQSFDFSISEKERDIMMSVEEECGRLRFDFDYMTCLTTIKKMNGIKGINGAAEEDPGKGGGDKKTHS
jgi:hypothetical protein